MTVRQMKDNFQLQKNNVLGNTNIWLDTEQNGKIKNNTVIGIIVQ